MNKHANKECYLQTCTHWLNEGMLPLAMIWGHIARVFILTTSYRNGWSQIEASIGERAFTERMQTIKDESS